MVLRFATDTSRDFFAEVIEDVGITIRTRHYGYHIMRDYLLYSG